MISNSDIQAAWISKLKSTATITNLVAVAEIRENNWKGEDFVYPNIRVKLGDLVPQTPNPNCKIYRSQVSILVFTEQKSSKQADDIAGVVGTAFWGVPFTNLGIRFISINLDSLSPAEVPESDQNSWQSSVNFSCLVQSA